METEESQHQPVSVSTASLLIVDDNSMNRIMLSRYTKRLGYQSTLVENGRQALEKLQNESFDLVLLDVQMPEMDGYQVLEQMKAHPYLREIPVIMISAVDELESTVRCIELGAQDYLPKPFSPVLLRARLAACLERKRLRDQEIDYLQQVKQVTNAAAAIKANTFELESLDEVTRRSDELGQLAQVFQEMARQVYAREQQLQQQVQQLRIEIDQERRAREVSDITESEYFQQLLGKADELRHRIKDNQEDGMQENAAKELDPEA